jgi:predicted amidohydrolase YtcJ
MESFAMEELKKFFPGTETILVHGGMILTMDETLPEAKALVIKNGRIAALGTKDEMSRLDGDDVVEMDVKGNTVLPGLIDTHPHLLHYGTLQEPLVDLSDAASHKDIVARIRARATETQPGEWIMCSPVGEPHYFIRRSYKDLKERVLPGREVLDKATKDHPVMIQAWAPLTPGVMAFNSMALDLLNITAETPARAHNVWVEKDPRGEPTGLLHGSVTNYYSDDPFNHEIWRRIPFLQNDAMLPGTRRNMKDYNRQGVTTVYENHMMDPPLIDVYRRLRRDNELRVRVMVAQETESYGMPWSRPRPMDKFVARLEQALGARDMSDDYLRFNGVTLMLDGTCFPGKLRMREPYLGPYGEMTAGESYTTPDKSEFLIRFCAEKGLRLNIIALGTQAHDDVLEQLERAAEDFPISSQHWILVHAFFVTQDQAERYAALGFDVTTTMSFCWGKGELFRRRMGDHVLADLIPLRRLLDAGMRVAGGSDWGPKYAFEQIKLALTHEFGESGERNLGPAQCISREEALAMWTRDAARVLQWKGIGKLAPGNHADLIIVDRNPMNCDIEAIGSIKVLRTLLGGTTVYDNGSLCR